MAGSLNEYWQKRDFKKTGEPRGRVARKRKQARFVIQKHDATALHYDVRFEIGGVLVSWAVPKGPSLNPQDKRLAMRTEDHPLDYYDFEGVIPEGLYGAGTVIVWDAGTVRPLDDEGSLDEQLRKGHLRVWLEGEKVRGGYTFQRTQTKPREKWLLIKRRDEHANARVDLTKKRPESILSGRTNADLERKRA